MNRLLTILAALVIVCCQVSVHAAPISAEKAAVVAQNFLAQTMKASTLVGKAQTTGQLEQQTWQYDAVYLFTLPQGGWVMVAADDCARPVLAYSLTGRLNPEAVAVQNIVSVYQQEIEQVRKVKGAPRHEEWLLLERGKSLNGAEEEEVGPLLTTQWFQKSPYNQLCPGNTMTGCVATAMAQVMKYWNYPAFGKGSHTYTDDSGYGSQSADFGNTRYDWDNMPNRLTGNSTAAEKTAVATLMYHCGVSVNMHYSTVYSGTSLIKCKDAMPDYFRYNRHDIRHCAKGQISNSDWTDTLIAELRLHRPILYGGIGPAGGHCFVCDGFNAQRYLHFNLGEDGEGDGYYQVGAITYGSYSFNQANEAILGLHPEYSICLNAETVSFTRYAGQQQVWLCSSDTVDAPWTATVQNDSPGSSSGNWIQVRDTAFSHLGQVTISVTENNTGAERIGTVLFTQGSLVATLRVVQEAYDPATDYCLLTVEMENTHNEPWAGDAHLSFESPSGTLYGIAKHTVNDRTSTTTVSVAPHDVMVRWHSGGALDRYINYKVKNRHGEVLVEVDNAYFYGEDVLIPWPCYRLGIDDPQNAAQEWNISPNPTTGRLTVTGGNDNGETVRLEVIDATGRVLLNTTGLSVDLAPLGTGVYYIRIITDNTVKVKKVVKN